MPSHNSKHRSSKTSTHTNSKDKYENVLVRSRTKPSPESTSTKTYTTLSYKRRRKTEPVEPPEKSRHNTQSTEKRVASQEQPEEKAALPKYRPTLDMASLKAIRITSNGPAVRLVTIPLISIDDPLNFVDRFATNKKDNLRSAHCFPTEQDLGRVPKMWALNGSKFEWKYRGLVGLHSKRLERPHSYRPKKLENHVRLTYYFSGSFDYRTDLPPNRYLEDLSPFPVCGDGFLFMLYGDIDPIRGPLFLHEEEDLKEALERGGGLERIMRELFARMWRDAPKC